MAMQKYRYTIDDAMKEAQKNELRATKAHTLHFFSLWDNSSMRQLKSLKPSFLSIHYVRRETMEQCFLLTNFVPFSSSPYLIFLPASLDW